MQLTLFQESNWLSFDQVTEQYPIVHVQVKFLSLLHFFAKKKIHEVVVELLHFLDQVGFFQN